MGGFTADAGGALTHRFCYRNSVVASLECYQKLEAYNGQQNQHTGESRIS